MPPVYKVLAFLYPTADILDFSGPIEVFSTNPPPGTPHSFEITTFAHSTSVKAAAGALTYHPDILFSTAKTQLEKYDILLVPGAHPDFLVKYLDSKEGKEFTALVARFAGLMPCPKTKTDGGGHRIVFSVCTGAFFLAAAGILNGRTVTTHHMGLETIKMIADQAAGGESGIQVVRKRWVDAGVTEQEVRIVTAGGVTSGLDASLWVVETVAGKQVADWVAEIVEFERREQEDGWGVEEARR
ncbi:transcriptional regulator [Lindgomyces ingoldianus]|uniref:Transcriptional regulator n=1 Tax=Lindgomyces ingoldianus TaxID=673940 RepID=A0ACB6QDL1_9PLEO|nr:transcriptional regulator [Lindgomyces ingoldianus]KAF2464212.1 transcriptional regulator [Lindgomyces ingoldianus]